MNKEMLMGQFKNIGHYGVRIGKTVLIEGCKAVVINTAKTVAYTGYEEGLNSVKELGWNDFLSDKEARVHKKLKKQEKVNHLKSENAKLKKQLAKHKSEMVVEVEIDETEVTN